MQDNPGYTDDLVEWADGEAVVWAAITIGALLLLGLALVFVRHL